MAQEGLWPLPSASPVRPTAPTAADAGPRAAAGGPAAPQRRWHSSELFGGAQEIEIAHGDAVYRLRLTALGKLILTK